MNRIDELFARKQKNVLTIYFTAGFPQLHDTRRILKALQDAEVDMVEIGIPFSDPLADGPVIQQSSKQALDNGMSLRLLFNQLRDVRREIHIPLILFGYVNVVMQFGIERFLDTCAEIGIDGLILPDLPLDEFTHEMASLCADRQVHFSFLITPETSEPRIRALDEASSGFLYVVSSSSTTGKRKDLSAMQPYFQRIQQMQLKNPFLVGFGIHDSMSFQQACQYSNGAVVGSAYIRALQEVHDRNVERVTRDFVAYILQPIRSTF
ncbi:MAG: tryptophan synthase subunit alpha [Thermoflavifilum sp.]|nr:tryptophan synthase subunit alpha [Thermoflavifilum sp.]